MFYSGVAFPLLIREYTGTMVKKAKKKAAKKACGNRGKGRPKGSQNVIKKGIRDALEEALASDGGEVAYFKMMKKEHPVPFLNVVAKLLPVQVEAELKGEIDTNVTITLIGATANGRD
jgi:hypothetical protein